MKITEKKNFPFCTKYILLYHSKRRKKTKKPSKVYSKLKIHSLKELSLEVYKMYPSFLKCLLFKTGRTYFN